MDLADDMELTMGVRYVRKEKSLMLMSCQSIHWVSAIVLGRLPIHILSFKDPRIV